MYQIFIRVAFLPVIFLLVTTISLSQPVAQPAMFETTIDSSAVSGTQEVQLDLGDRICCEIIDVEWKILNPLPTSIKWPRSTSSCGCITNFPQSLSVPPANKRNDPGEELLKFRIKLPAKPDSLNRQIMFWDAGGTAHLQATVLANVLAPIRLEKQTLHIDDESRVTKVIGVNSASDEIDLRDLQMSLSGAEIVGTDFRASNRSTGTLRVEIDPKLAGSDSTQSTIQVDLQRNDSPIGQLPMTIHYKHRTVAIPKTPIFQKQGEEYRSQFVMRSAGLVAALIEKNPLNVFAIEQTGLKETKIALSVETPPSKPDIMLCKLDIVLRAGSIPKGFKPKKLLFQCGKWEHELLCQFPD
jgi:hypothetical protein